MPKELIDAAINQALIDATNKGIVGKDVSPFLLAAIKEITGGTSLKANIELVLNNARLGAQIATHYQEVKK